MTATALRNVPADWFAQDGEELAKTLTVVFSMVRDENEWRTDKDEYHWGLYEGSGMGGVTTRSRRGMTYLNATLPDNICKTAVDTLTAKVATIRPIPLVFTQRGNWTAQRKARKLRQFGEGEFYAHQIHEKLAPRIIKDALTARGGCVQVYDEGKKSRVERVHPWTVYYDDWDAEFGEPLTCMRLRTMDRATAIKKFGTTKAKKKKLEEAGRFSSATQVIRDEERSSTVERVELVEAWYRCMDHDTEDPDHKCAGRHVIICENELLWEDEDGWPHNFFPFAWLFYDTPNTGFFGSGLVQTLEGYQVSINEANEKHSEAISMSGKLIILRDGSGLLKTDITNGYRVAHARPGPYAPELFDMDLVNEHIRMRPVELAERALNASGVSSMAAQGKKPAGVESGIALQTLDDVETQRHIVFGRRFESWCMDVMRLLFEVAKKIAKKHGDYAVKVPMKGAYLDLSWKDVEIDGFQLHLQSVGQLYMSFAGKLDKLKTLFEMGAIDRGTFMRHMDAGDVQAELDLETADKLLVDEVLEAMLDTKSADEANDNYLDPYGDLPLAWAHRRAHQKKLQSQMDGAPKHVLDMLQRFIDDVKYLEEKAAADAAAKAAPPAGPMPLGGGPPPPPVPAPPDGGIPMDPGMAASAPGNLMPTGGMAPPIAA